MTAPSLPTDAASQSRPDPTVAERAADGFMELVKTVLFAVVFAGAFRIILFDPFNIPSSSMEPTLLVGDYLLVSKFAYGYSRHSTIFSLPVGEGRLFGRMPERGDVIVFRLPRDPDEAYIKRLIGLPGDRVRLTNGRLYINGELVPREPLDIVEGTVQQLNPQTQLPETVTRPHHRYWETLPGGRRHLIYEISDGNEYDNWPEHEVPAGHFLMMGDNRDNSQDGRTDLVGFVPFENLVGRAEVIFFSVDGQFWEVWDWPWSLRLGRFFRTIR